MATQKATSEIPPEKLELYDRLIAAHPEIKRKGASLPYTSVNGHMFSFLSQTGALGLRLPEEARAAFLKKYKTTLVEAHGTVLKEYVAVPDPLLKKTAELRQYLDLSYEYVKTLKPKAQQKGKPRSGKR